MNATTASQTVALSPDDVQARIDDERRRLLLEQNVEQELAAQRVAPLEAGDDEALDRVESQINASRQRQFRIQERIELLERRHVEAIEAQKSAGLDLLAACANRARLLGESLIHEYSKLAPQLASILQRLSVVDIAIADYNRRLDREGRPHVASPNVIRVRPRRRWTEVVKKMVSPAERGHPWFGKPYVQSTNSPELFSLKGETMKGAVEIEVEEERTDWGDSPVPLYEAAILPDVGPAEADKGLATLWSKDRRPDDAVISEVLQQIENDEAMVPKRGRRATS